MQLPLRGFEFEMKFAAALTEGADNFQGKDEAGWVQVAIYETQQPIGIDHLKFCLERQCMFVLNYMD